MDCLGTFLGTMVTDIGRGMCRSTYTRAVFTTRFKSNANALKNAINGLVKVQNKVNQDFKTLEIKGKSLHVQLRRWLRDVEDTVSQANSMQERRVSCAPFLKCRIGKKLVVTLEKVKRLEKIGVELLDKFYVEGNSELVEIILTCRFLDVCQSIRTDIDFRVDCLCEEEAWELFCQNAGQVTRSDRIRPIAKKVARECGGLPLAIITVGMAMRGKKIDKLWKHALKELKSAVPYVKSIKENIYQPLKLSYDSLERKMKSCFLLCALFPEDYSIEVAELVRYWIAEGFIDDIANNNSYLMYQGIVLVENLKDSCLLEEGARDGTVKMLETT